MSQSITPVRTERAPAAPESVTTAVGITAEREVRADRERRTAQARLAAQRLDRREADPRG
jgi:hypothetical protein